MGRYILIAMLALSTVVFAGCGADKHEPPEGEQDPKPYATGSYTDCWKPDDYESVCRFDMPDNGQKCVVFRYDRGGGIDCDWSRPE